MTGFSERIPSSETSRTVLAAIGIGCFLRLVLRSHKTFLPQPASDSWLPYFPHLAFLAALLVAFCLGIVFRKRLDAGFLESPRPALASLVTCAASYALYLACRDLAGGALWALLLLAALHALGIAGALFAWGAVLYKLEQKRALFAIVLSLGAYGLLNLGAFATPVVSPQVLNVLVSLLMLCAWPFSYQRGSAIAPREETGTLRELPLSTLAIFLIGVLACAVTTGLLALDDQDHMTLADIVASILVPLLMSGALYAGFKSTETEESFRTILTVTNVLLIVIALLLAVVFMALDSSSRVPSTLLKAARCLCVVCCIAVLSQSMHQKALSPTMLFSLLGILAFVVPITVERYLLPVLDRSTNAFLATYDEVIVLVISAVLIVVAFVSLAADHLLSISNSDDDEKAADRLERAYEIVAQGYGLTPREKEVMALIAEGNSMKKVADTLFISLGTVQSHSKAIYRKLDIHSRQELVDIVNAHPRGFSAHRAFM